MAQDCKLKPHFNLFSFSLNRNHKGATMLKHFVNVVIVRPLKQFGGLCLNEKYQKQISNISPRIKVMDISSLIQAEESGDTAAKKQVDAILAESEVLHGFPPPANLIARAPNLKWIQSPLTGIDHFLTPDIVASPVLLSNSRGIHGSQVSELAIMLMLMLSKRAAACIVSQKENKWQPFTPDILYHKTVGILGLGVIGTELAKLLRAFHMNVLVMESRKVKKPGFVDEIMPPSQLNLILEKSDFVVVTLPLIPETEKIINESALHSMKPTAFLINVARGGIIDEKALIRALQEKWIAGAGLDVFEIEPLPASSELWRLPNVIITPHCAGRRPDYDKLATDLFCKNLRNYLSGKDLLNLIDKRKGF
jgi:phosphoglycerate dehydrogenase-like enzyme